MLGNILIYQYILILAKNRYNYSNYRYINLSYNWIFVVCVCTITRGSYQCVDSSSICVSGLQVLPQREFLAHQHLLCLRHPVPWNQRRSINMLVFECNNNNNIIVCSFQPVMSKVRNISIYYDILSISYIDIKIVISPSTSVCIVLCVPWYQIVWVCHV